MKTQAIRGRVKPGVVDLIVLKMIWPLTFMGLSDEAVGSKRLLSFLDDLPKPKNTELLEKGVESVQEYSASEEREEGRRWRVFRIGDQEHRVDMKAIEPYKKVISHGGQWCCIIVRLCSFHWQDQHLL